jgi:DNA-binding transcriptional MocR family regulator
MAKEDLLYQHIAQSIEDRIRTDILKVGDKVPSLRSIREEYSVSMNTALQAYYHLETKGLIESRPQSGYYVSFAHKHILPAPSTSNLYMTHGLENVEDVIEKVSANKKQAEILLSSGVPELALLPVARLNKAITHAIRHLPDSGITYDHDGNVNLKHQIAMRSPQWGGKLKDEDIIPTAGCMDAIAYSMMSLVKSGDTIAVESPVFYGFLQIARSFGLKVIELPTHPVTGVEIDALKKLLEKKKIQLCLFASNFSNPLGSTIPDAHKKEIVKLLQKHNIPLIEDDIYGDLYLGNQRPKTCKTFDESGLVLWCGSFSKTLASGYRVGWVAPGKFKDKIARMKLYHSVASNSLAHEAIAYFLENNRYDAHLRQLRQHLHASLLQYLRCISEYFPEGTKVSHPQGGFILWVELDKNADALKLYDKAIRHRISIAPGSMYTLQKQYHNCFRIGYGFKWSEKLENALKLLGKLAHQV